MFNIFFRSLSEIIDRAFKKARSAGASARKSIRGSRIEKKRKVELIKINTVYQIVKSDINKIKKEFPPLKTLPEFYQELIPLISDYRKISDFLKRIKFVESKIDELYYRIKNKIKSARTINDIIKFRKEFYGRVASLLNESEEKYQNFLKEAKKLRRIPNIKQLPTIAIAGLPNVGKSTLLKKLTGSEPEIKPYPFTTQGLMLGYLDTPFSKIQIIDTPGILDRPIEQMNNIEKQALLAIKKLANLIIYIFDLTETCGFSIEEQERLLEQLITNLKISRKTIVIYYSKFDLFTNREKDLLKLFVEKYSNFPQFYDIEKIKEWIIEWIRKRKDLWS